tara:strand:+ start:812 stop:1147 length:336 start_codon:yes stop_codon:yes gene_type:complete
MDNKEKIEYIQNNITNNEKNIFKTIKEYDIPYTKNNNGIFINLSKINENMIDKIYDNIKNDLYITDNIRNTEITKYKKSLSVKNPEKKTTYKKFENLSESDLQTINYSKKI